VEALSAQPPIRQNPSLWRAEGGTGNGYRRHAGNFTEEPALASYAVSPTGVAVLIDADDQGALKFIPGASPAQELAVRTLDKLSLGIVSGDVALYVTAIAECFIGITLISGKILRAGLLVLAASLVGIMSPLLLFFTDLFPGAVTLEAQYILKDLVPGRRRTGHRSARARRPIRVTALKASVTETQAVARPQVRSGRFSTHPEARVRRWHLAALNPAR
jgi:hypothetical protein